MKNVRKLFLMILIGVILTLVSTQVFAADPWDEPFENAVDLTQNTVNETPAVQNQIEEQQNNVVENKNVNNVTNNNTNTNSNNNSNTNTNKNTNKNSSYNNSNLPKTGAEDVLPIAALVVVFGVSAVFAYKKVSDYKNL